MDAEAKSSSKDESLNVLCAICNEFYNASDIIYTTSSCGHVFHKGCLFRWLGRSRSCPQCRSVCHQQRVHRVYLNFAERTEVEEVERLQVQWVPCNVALIMRDFDTYVARVYLHEDLLPANFVPHKRAVYTPWNCSAHHLNTAVDLLVLTDCELKWEQASHGNVPSNALKTGYAESGEVLYTGRALHDHRMLLGKVHPSHGVLYMPYAGNEVNTNSYEVLVVTPKEQAER
ncbi:hypothetical protein ACLKA6_002420 [Drosophila palustris]